MEVGSNAPGRNQEVGISDFMNSMANPNYIKSESQSYSLIDNPNKTIRETQGESMDQSDEQHKSIEKDDTHSRNIVLNRKAENMALASFN